MEGREVTQQAAFVVGCADRVFKSFSLTPCGGLVHAASQIFDFNPQCKQGHGSLPRCSILTRSASKDTCLPRAGREPCSSPELTVPSRKRSHLSLGVSA